MTGSSDTPEFDPVLAAAEAIDAEVHAEPLQPGAEPEPAEPAAPEIDTAELLANLLQPAFVILAPAWEIKPAESQALAGAWAPVIDKYFPNLSMGVELQAALVTLAIIGPRLGRAPKPKPKQAEAQPEQASGAPPGFENQAN